MLRRTTDFKPQRVHQCRAGAWNQWSSIDITSGWFRNSITPVFPIHLYSKSRGYDSCTVEDVVPDSKVSVAWAPSAYNNQLTATALGGPAETLQPHWLGSCGSKQQYIMAHIPGVGPILPQQYQLRG